jgi:formate dehydrogenase subunit gamma
MVEFRPWDEDHARDIIAAHVAIEGAAIPILHALQHAFGCVPIAAEPLVASALNISRAEVHGVVTFYHEFRRTPPGRHIMRICRAEACQAVGGEAIAADLLSRLGIGWHGTSADGAVTLEPVFCLGLCATAPAALVDGHPAGRLTTAKIDRILETLA